MNKNYDLSTAINDLNQSRNRALILGDYLENLNQAAYEFSYNHADATMLAVEVYQNIERMITVLDDTRIGIESQIAALEQMEVAK